MQGTNTANSNMEAGSSTWSLNDTRLRPLVPPTDIAPTTAHRLAPVHVALGGGVSSGASSAGVTPQAAEPAPSCLPYLGAPTTAITTTLPMISTTPLLAPQPLPQTMTTTTTSAPNHHYVPLQPYQQTTANEPRQDSWNRTIGSVPSHHGAPHPPPPPPPPPQATRPLPTTAAPLSAPHHHYYYTPHQPSVPASVCYAASAAGTSTNIPPLSSLPCPPQTFNTGGAHPSPYFHQQAQTIPSYNKPLASVVPPMPAPYYAPHQNTICSSTAANVPGMTIIPAGVAGSAAPTHSYHYSVQHVLHKPPAVVAPSGIPARAPMTASSPHVSVQQQTIIYSTAAYPSAGGMMNSRSTISAGGACSTTRPPQAYSGSAPLHHPHVVGIRQSAPPLLVANNKSALAGAAIATPQQNKIHPPRAYYAHSGSATLHHPHVVGSHQSAPPLLVANNESVLTGAVIAQQTENRRTTNSNSTTLPIGTTSTPPHHQASSISHI